MKAARLALLALVAAGVVAVVVVARPGSAHSGERPGESTITVSGTGLVSTQPDRAVLAFGVETTAPTAAAALSANSTTTRAVIAALLDAGIARADVQTIGISVSTNYSNGHVDGYVARNFVSVKIADLERAGAVIDAAVAAGANQVYGPSLLRSDRQELYRVALRAAFVDARARAEALANASGMTIIRAATVEEGGGGGGGFASPTAAPATGATPVEPGTQEIHATVSVTFVVT